MRVPGLKTLQRWSVRQRGRWFGGVVILGYHRVASDPHDPHGLTVTPDLFREQMAVVRRSFLPIPLCASLAPHGNRDSSPGWMPVAITFDDGYRDVLKEALPILEELQIPATLFVVTGAHGEPFWWDALRWLISQGHHLPPSLDLPAPSGPIRWTSGEGARALVDRLFLNLRCEPEGLRQEVLSRVWNWAGVDQAAPLPQVLSGTEIRELDAHPLIEIGSHTRSHPALPGLPNETMTQEVAGSREELSALLGRPINGFSYPFGLEDKQVRRRVREAGYMYACSSRAGLLTRGTDPHLLPRLWSPAVDGGRFRHWIRSWTGR